MINLINFAELFRNQSNVHFLFVGEGDEVTLLQTEREKRKLDNISYLPAVNQDLYFDILSDIDIGMFSLHPDHTTHNFPGKLLGYLYEKPIIGIANQANDLVDVINGSGAGYVIDHTSIASLEAYVLDLIRNPDMRLNTSKNAKKLLREQFSVESAYEIIIGTLGGV